MELDLSLPESPERLLDAVTELLGPHSILVNNAARSTRDGYKALDAATLDAHYAVNLRATALLSVVFAQRFDGETGGRIVNLTSAEVGHKGMTVNAVNLDPTDTGWMTEELRQELSAKFSARRVGEPEDAARLVAFLASDEAAWITGQVIHSEGGFLRS